MLTGTITGPLHTIAASMQLSVLPHLNLYKGQDTKASTLISETIQKKMIGADEKALMKSSGANVKVYKAKRKAKLIKESG